VRALSWPSRLAFAVACATLLAGAWAFRRHVVDDTYISLRYADHLASGLGYVFNPGENVEGASNLMWVLVLAAARALGANPLVASQVLGALAALATLFFQLGLSARLSGGRPSAIGPWLTALSAPFALWAVAGLETGAYACALTAATLAAAHDLAAPRAHWRVAILFLIVALLRPEGAMFAGPYLALRLGLAIRGGSPWRDAAVPITIFIGGIAAVTLWRWLTFHALVPNTVLAKVFFASPRPENLGLLYLWRWCATGAGVAVPLALVTLSGRAAGAGGVTALLWAAIALQMAFVVAVGGDWMPAFRFVVPVLPLLHVLAGQGATDLWQRLRPRLAVPAVAPVAATLAAALTLAVHTYAVRRQLQEVEPYVVGLARGHASLGRWLKDAAPPGARLAIADCGAVPYFSELPTLDLLGLTDSFVARNRHRAVAHHVVHELRPELVVLALRYVEGPPALFRGFFKTDGAVVADTAFTRGWLLAGVWPFMPSSYNLYVFARRGVRLRAPPPGALGP